MQSELPSKSAARRAGAAIKRFHRGELGVDDLDPHLKTLIAYRKSFMLPMEQVHSHLSHLIKQAEIDAEVSYRLKKASTIFEKLKRESGLELDRMHDFGGCRAVVEDRKDLLSLRQNVERAFNVKRTYDYIEEPRLSGYRAVHLIVTVDTKLIEIQLRTKAMHKWAETAEAFSMRLGQNFKQDGEHQVQRLLWALAEQSNAIETGGFLGGEVSDKIDQLIPEILRLLSASDQRNK